jgi:PAS domain S-box-containing protein
LNLDALVDDERLKALNSTGLLDSAADDRFDRVTRIVGRALDAPVALVSLVHKDRQFFKSAIGLPEPWRTCRETPLSHSFCQFVVEHRAALRVVDARRDPRVADNRAVPELGVVAYLGVPIYAGGHAIGSLCAIDTKPREWTNDDENMLRDLASIVENEIGLISVERRWREILNTMPQMVWSALPDGFHDFYNDRWYEFTGVRYGSTDGEGWNGMFHPDDQERAWTRWRESLETGRLYEIEYRLRHKSGVYRWTLGRALPIRGANGQIERWFGTCTDIHDLRSAADEMRKLAAVVKQSSDFIGIADPSGRVSFINDAGLRLVGLPDMAAVGSTAILDYFPPEHHDQIQNGALPSAEASGYWEGDLSFQNFATGELIPVRYNLFPIRDENGATIAYATTTVDQRERRRAEAAQELISRELAHRIQNIFAVVGSLVGMSARENPAAREFATAVRSRIQALSRAHLYVRPGGRDLVGGEHDRTIQGLIETVLAPYMDSGRPDAIDVSGCDAPIDMRAATALALTLHELATNAVKYGALSSDAGRLTLTCVTDEAAEAIKLVWRESGGPAIFGAPVRSGFGSELLIGSVVTQLGAELVKHWEADGLMVEIKIPLNRLNSTAPGAN